MPSEDSEKNELTLITEEVISPATSVKFSTKVTVLGDGVDGRDVRIDQRTEVSFQDMRECGCSSTVINTVILTTDQVVLVYDELLGRSISRSTRDAIRFNRHRDQLYGNARDHAEFYSKMSDTEYARMFLSTVSKSEDESLDRFATLLSIVCALVCSEMIDRFGHVDGLEDRTA
jgi:hypothetical protein